MDGWMDRWMDGWLDRWMDGWMDNWMDRKRITRGNLKGSWHLLRDYPMLGTVLAYVHYKLKTTFVKASAIAPFTDKETSDLSLRNLSRDPLVKWQM